MASWPSPLKMAWGLNSSSNWKPGPPDPSPGGASPWSQNVGRDAMDLQVRVKARAQEPADLGHRARGQVIEELEDHVAVAGHRHLEERMAGTDGGRDGPAAARHHVR